MYFLYNYVYVWHAACVKMSRKELKWRQYPPWRGLLPQTPFPQHPLCATRPRSSALTLLHFQGNQQQNFIGFLTGKWASLKLRPWCRFIQAVKCHFLHPSAKRVWISGKAFFKNSPGFIWLQNSEQACLKANVHPSSQNINSYFIIDRMQKLPDEKAIKEKRP